MKTRRSLEEGSCCNPCLHRPRNSPSFCHGSSCQLLFTFPGPSSRSPHPPQRCLYLPGGPSPQGLNPSSRGSSSKLLGYLLPSDTAFSSEICHPRGPPSKLLGSIKPNLPPPFILPALEVPAAFCSDYLCANSVVCPCSLSAFLSFNSCFTNSL